MNWLFLRGTYYNLYQIRRIYINNKDLYLEYSNGECNILYNISTSEECLINKSINGDTNYSG